MAGIEPGISGVAGTHGRNEEGASQLGVEIDHILPFGHRNNYLIIFDDFFVPSVSRSLSLAAFIETAVALSSL